MLKKIASVVLVSSLVCSTAQVNASSYFESLRGNTGNYVVSGVCGILALASSLDALKSVSRLINVGSATNIPALGNLRRRVVGTIAKNVVQAAVLAFCAVKMFLTRGEGEAVVAPISLDWVQPVK